MDERPGGTRRTRRSVPSPSAREQLTTSVLLQARQRLMLERSVRDTVARVPNRRYALPLSYVSCGLSGRLELCPLAIAGVPQQMRAVSCDPRRVARGCRPTERKPTLLLVFILRPAWIF